MSFHAQSSSESACFLSRVQVGKSVDVTHVYISCRFGHNGSALSSNVLVRILNDGPNRYLFCVTRRDLFLSCTVVIELLAKLIDQSRGACPGLDRQMWTSSGDHGPDLPQLSDCCSRVPDQLPLPHVQMVHFCPEVFE